jgi:hypothetical protein
MNAGTTATTRSGPSVFVDFVKIKKREDIGAMRQAVRRLVFLKPLMGPRRGLSPAKSGGQFPAVEMQEHPAR